MKLVIYREIAKKIGLAALEPYGLRPDEWDRWNRDHQDLDLAKFSRYQLDDLVALFEAHKGARGVNVLLSDLRAWLTVLDGGAASGKARTVRQFEALLTDYLLRVPGHRVYARHDDAWLLGYYVDEIKYHPPEKRSDFYNPAHVDMRLLYEATSGVQSRTVSFGDTDVRGVPVAAALADKGYLVENTELRAEYLADVDRHKEIVGQIGRQFWGRGRSWIKGDRWDRSVLNLDRDGEPSRVVMDVFFENDERNPGSSGAPHMYWWQQVKSERTYDPDTDTDGAPVDENTVEAPEPVEIPIHPWVVVFHLQKHVRLECHSAQLEEYVYDEALADKLILPPDQKSLVKLLIDTKGGGFEDIVRGKGGGAVVLLAGPPGTGKTLTAEVYAESEKKPLYSVQCSQLGTDPNTLEKGLLAVFARAKRWDAVMLLDEADVYVHARGVSMTQNAIVGVFLRVLEYQDAVLFLTTNRPDDVDDAIASRCIARITFGVPSPEDAVRIWQVLVRNYGKVWLPEDEIEQMVKRNPYMTGRDIKNTFKLASLLPHVQGDMTKEHALTVADLEYVKQFQPTGFTAGEHGRA